MTMHNTSIFLTYKDRYTLFSDWMWCMTVTRKTASNCKPDSLAEMGSHFVLGRVGVLICQTNWDTFLCVDGNKVALYEYLAHQATTIEVPEEKQLINTNRSVVPKNLSNVDVDLLQPCYHEEADYRMMLHCTHAHKQGHKVIIINATYTDCLVLAVAAASIIPECEILIGFGHGKYFRHIPAHIIARELGSERSWALLFLYAFTGSDTTSSFCGIGKKTSVGFVEVDASGCRRFQPSVACTSLCE